jgi:uroporphyrinogen-III synthase
VRLLVTRPEPDAERTAAALRHAGHQVDVAALLLIETIADAQLGSGPWSALAVTSANALRAVASHPRCADLKGLRVFAVGRRTAAAARAAGFADVVAAGGDVQELARRLREWAQEEQGEQDEGNGDQGEHRKSRERGPLLYLAGQDRSGDLAGDLAAAGHSVSTVAVYRAVKADRFPPAIDAALAAGQIEGVLHFSRRSAEAYVNCARAAALLERALVPVHYCVSRQIAEPLVAAGAKDLRIAAVPQESALIDLIGSQA